MKKDKRSGRPFDQLRPLEVIPGFHRLAEGSVLYRAEGTVVLATASVEESVPKFLEGKGQGWLTAEYQMHPRSNPQRREARDGRTRPLGGRAKEIERLVGRSLRAALDMARLGERTIVVDCDILEADGGTRTASITAGWIALALALDKLYTRGLFSRSPLRDQVAAISVGDVDDRLALDLCYAEDVAARVDLNLVATARGAIVEVQGTAEGEAIERGRLDEMIDLGLLGIQQLCVQQLAILRSAGCDPGRLLPHAQ